MKQLFIGVFGLVLGLLPSSVFSQQTQPPLDISGIDIIRALPIGALEVYDKENSIKILNSIANLAVMQFDVEKFVIKAVNPYTKQEEEVIGGEFGRILRHEILGLIRGGKDLVSSTSNLSRPQALPPNLMRISLSWISMEGRLI